MRRAGVRHQHTNLVRKVLKPIWETTSSGVQRQGRRPAPFAVPERVPGVRRHRTRYTRSAASCCCKKMLDKEKAYIVCNRPQLDELVRLLEAAASTPKPVPQLAMVARRLDGGLSVPRRCARDSNWLAAIA